MKITRRGVLLTIALVWVGLSFGALITFFDAHGRLPVGNGELINWLMGWS